VRPLIGARGSLGDSWTWEITALQSQDWTQYEGKNGIANYVAIQNALNASDPAVALNPFTSGSPGSEALLQTLFSDAFIKYMGRGQSLNAVLHGPVFDLPAGTVQVALGGEYDRDKLYTNVISAPSLPPGSTTFTRRSSAVFGEARIPILSGQILDAGTGAPRQVDSLALTIAARHDDYSDFGGTTNPQFGLEWRPLHGFLYVERTGEPSKRPHFGAFTVRSRRSRELL